MIAAYPQPVERAERPVPDPRLPASPWTGFRISFLAHLVVYVATILLIFLIDPYSGLITALAWGIPLGLHALFAVVVPDLRRRWVADELARAVPVARADERRASGDKHARETAELAGSLAHEIRNPIAAAKSLVQQIVEDPTSKDAPEYARVALAELDRVEASIVHLLRFAREEPLHVVEVELDDVVSAALEAAKEKLAGVRVEREHARVSVRADEEKLRRVVLNLVHNAADAMRGSPAERRVLHLQCGRSLDGRSAWIRVRDEGAGMDAAVRERAFDAWVTDKASGTGLGLPIARKLCEAHGGSLEIERSDAAGTSMLVTIPRGVA